MSNAALPPDALPGARPGALAGVRVLEFSALIAGPSAARYLSDHGAEVIKIERFPGGDASRITNRAGSKRSAMFIQHNGGKKSLCVDLTQAVGLEIARDLVRKSDVVIEAFTPGVMARLGLGYEGLESENNSVLDQWFRTDRPERGATWLCPHCALDDRLAGHAIAVSRPA
jgi:crotonobetainyl-CoA:carnitine CoA-transferase CaiB-like acyl-CoA transferase